MTHRTTGPRRLGLVLPGAYGLLLGLVLAVRSAGLGSGTGSLGLGPADTAWFLLAVAPGAALLQPFIGSRALDQPAAAIVLSLVTWALALHGVGRILDRTWTR